MTVRPRCPAALPLDGPPASGPAVICGVAVEEAKKADQVASGAYRGQLVTRRKDPSTFFGFCCGKALPVLHQDQDHSRASYTNCPVWQMEKDRIWAARWALEPAPSRGSTVPLDSDGNPMAPVPDPGDALDNLAGLNELAPPEKKEGR